LFEAMGKRHGGYKEAEVPVVEVSKEMEAKIQAAHSRRFGK